MRLLVTDLDNTLYDWVSFYSQAVDALVSSTASIAEVPKTTIYSELQKLHQKFGNSETPFAILELPSIRTKFPKATRRELMQLTDAALHAFNSVRKRELRPYPEVIETLASLQELGIRIVGHTEALSVNAYYRLIKLDLAKYFSRLYTASGRYPEHPDLARESRLHWPEDLVVELPPDERKPNPNVLRDICRREGFDITKAVYVGDSLTRDVFMAREANVKCVWARYGRNYDSARWDTLLKITHWTPEDVAAEEAILVRSKVLEPDYVIESFGEILDLPLFKP